MKSNLSTNGVCTHVMDVGIFELYEHLYIMFFYVHMVAFVEIVPRLSVHIFRLIMVHVHKVDRAF